MKVKTLSGNILLDYKKVDKGTVIDLTDSVAKRYISAGLVEAVIEVKQPKKDKE